ncbi:MAG TPA: AAA family ATPase [Solirubrobacteraceae bacterium]|nr:AAA family ATPase [Solirubrobacteraceae bacterium]
MTAQAATFGPEDVAALAGTPQASETNSRAADPVHTFPLLSVTDLAKLKPPEWLIDGMLPAGGFSVLFGPSGVGKSFLALDWALCVATALAWYRRAVRGGWVLYIAAEGRSGLGVRVQAWQQARRQRDIEHIRFLPEAVNLLDAGQLAKARRTLADLPEPPALVVVDTMARSMVGGDENAARDVGMFIAAADDLCKGSGAARLIVHHTGKNGEDERGSSALRGAADLMAALKPDGAGIRLECVKAKDSEEFEPWFLHLEPTADSCVLALGTRTGGLAPAETQLLREVSAAFGTRPVSGTKIRDASELARSTYYRTLKALVDRGLLAIDGNERRPIYTLTAEGEAAAVPTSPMSPNGTGPVESHAQPSLEAGTWDAGRAEAAAR